jgi:hypothetical protein
VFEIVASPDIATEMLQHCLPNQPGYFADVRVANLLQMRLLHLKYHHNTPELNQEMHG